MIHTPIGGALVTLFIGLLLGLERERSQGKAEGLFAGIRTFPLLTLSGYIAGFAADHGAALVLPATLLGIGGLAAISYLRSSRQHAGATTEVLAVFAPLLGALVQWGLAPLAASTAVVTTLLLTQKAPLHKIAGNISEEEIVAILKFGLVAVVLVPLLPSRPMGPYDAIVPRQVGVVVLILSGVSLLAYLLVRLLGDRTGWVLAGLLGGMVSSTAVTLSFSGKARSAAGAVRPLAVGVVLASTVLYLRSLLVISIFDRELGAYVAPRLVGLFALGAVFAAVLFRKKRTGVAEKLPLGNPVELGHALTLSLLFTGILVLSRVAQAKLGAGGLWLTGLVGGFIDVDSVAVAAARLHGQGLAPVEVAGGSILLATLSNALLKSGVVATIGGADLAKLVLPAFGVLVAATAAILALG